MALRGAGRVPFSAPGPPGESGLSALLARCQGDPGAGAPGWHKAAPVALGGGGGGTPPTTLGPTSGIAHFGEMLRLGP